MLSQVWFNRSHLLALQHQLHAQNRREDSGFLTLPPRPPPPVFLQGKEQGPTHPDREKGEFSHDPVPWITGCMAQWISDLYFSSQFLCFQETF